jgi:hypothetical protein
MKLEYKNKTNIGILLALLLHVAGAFISSSAISGLLNLLGIILFIYGCCMYSKGKGHHGAWGLLGFLSILGLIILIFFKDRHKGES